MTQVLCEACGSVLVATPAHAGLTVGCPSCGATLRVPEASVRRDGEPPRTIGRAPEPPLEAPRPTAAAGSAEEVPPPRATGSDSDAARALALAAASLAVPLIGPFALWYSVSASRRLRERGGEEPPTLRHARMIATVGTVLLGLLLVCGIPIVLVLG